MSDISKMLRSEALIADEDWTGIYGISPNLAFAAADRIEKLEEALREVLSWVDQYSFDAAYDDHWPAIEELARKELDAE